MSLRILAAPAIFLLGALADLSGCVTTITPEHTYAQEAEPPRLDFPDVHVCLVQTSHVLHEVKFYFEMDRLPAKDEEPVFGWLVNVPGQAEEYLAGYEDNPAIQAALKSGGKPKVSLLQEAKGTHRFTYDHGMFVIGGFRYPAEQYGEIIIFKERPGSFTLGFHGRKILIEKDSPWKPAVLYRLNREEVSQVEPEAAPEKQVSPRNRQRTQARNATTRIVSEEVQVGAHRIIAVPGEGIWTVNDLKVMAPPGATITINRRGEVKSTT